MKLMRRDRENDGPLSESAMRSKLESLGYRVSSYHYSPGTVFPPHAHGVDKIDGVLAGRFEMEMDGQSIVLEAGDMLAVPRGAVHAARVIGNATVISLDAVKYQIRRGLVETEEPAEHIHVLTRRAITVYRRIPVFISQRHTAHQDTVFRITQVFLDHG